VISSLVKAFRGQLIDDLSVGLAEVLSILGDEADGREGGFFRFFTINWFGPEAFTPVQHVAELVGRVPTDKFPKYEEFSREKAERIIRNLKNGESHVSSWQSRDPDRERYGGAIMVHIPAWQVGGGAPSVAILTFSGLPEKADEALMIWVAYQLSWLSKEEAGLIIEESNNEIARKILDTN